MPSILRSLSRYFLLGICVFASFFVISIFQTFYPDYLWFSSFGYGDLWLRVVSAKATVFGCVFGLSFFWILGNFCLANWVAARTVVTGVSRFQTPFSFLNKRLYHWASLSEGKTISGWSWFLSLAVSIGSALFLAFFSMDIWQVLYAGVCQVPFGISDPIFHHDLAFYFFTIPAIEAIYGLVVVWFLVGLGVAGWVYVSRHLLVYIFGTGVRNRWLKIHVFVLLALVMVWVAVYFGLQSFQILYGKHGVVVGAGYTAVMVRLFAYRVMVVLSLLQAALLVFYAFRVSVGIPIISLVVLGGATLLGVGVYPNMVQRYVVTPNEFEKEKIYIEHNIEFTRKAYGLDRFEVVSFPAKTALTSESLRDNASTIHNVSLWNAGPLKQTFSQLQEIRLYYAFPNIDVDRYRIGSELKQVMLSPRELDMSQLPSQAQTWVNRHLVYSHGFGLVMTPVNEVTPEGLPHFYIQDIPPVSHVPITVKQPEIYFGEKEMPYAIVNTRQPEFDYPKGDMNVYAHYQGKGGVKLDSLFKRLVYALKFSDIKFLISSLISSESRLLYDRTVLEIVQKVTPFVVFEQDPYLVVSDDGRLVWMVDGYMVSDRYPYSEPVTSRGLNYIRNSVKATVDAYSGQAHFYCSDEKDPMIKTYQRIYPGLFKPFAEMPRALQEHIRYPALLFGMQASMYRTYHMVDPQVFYNREDGWEFPHQNSGEEAKIMEPYYMTTRLPGEKDTSFILMVPFTPTNKSNMIAWLGAKCDLANYGQTKVYMFPKERTIYGPMQIESRIDQDTEISQKLTLWGQVGSRVIRGNLVVVPIEDSLIYVEPIYLQATQGKLPELKRVVFAYGDQLVMEETLGQGINKLFSGAVSDQVGQQSPRLSAQAMPIAVSSEREKAIRDLVQEYALFKQYSKEGAWEKWGGSLRKIDRLMGAVSKR